MEERLRKFYIVPIHNVITSFFGPGKLIYSPHFYRVFYVCITFQEGSATVECRYDWHQTATHVTVAIYAKKYDPDISKVEIHPIRLKAHVYFPEQAGAFDLDIELAGVRTRMTLIMNM